jgi:hypothetical protein
MRKTFVAVAAILGLARLAGAQATAPLAMREAVDCATAGMALAVPEGFVAQPLTGRFEVLRSTAVEDGKPVIAVTLSAFPVDEKVTADDFADARFAELKNDLVVRYPILLKRTPMPVAGVNGAARLLTYTYRGIDTVAAQVVFLRTSKPGETRICYAITVESAPTHQQRMLQVLGAVTKSASPTAMRHPDLAAAARRPTRSVPNPALGAAIRCPDTWNTAVSAIGTESWQADFILGGEPVPSVRLFVTTPPAGASSSEACSNRYLAMARLAAKEHKQTCQVISEGAAAMGKLAAHEFVIKQGPSATTAPSAGPAEPAIVILQRTALASEADGSDPRAYVLVLTAREPDLTSASQLMAAAATSFERFAPTTQAGTQPTTRPSTQPAMQPATRASQPAGGAGIR